ncbi:MAG: cytochrome b N-terminal domain-containing protein [Deltaproteobacteria bacterium]|nr:cytochrome b N-terminal domain-containing protein [Deltaproteobacteria bacterium]
MGGPEVGPATLSNFYAIHTAILPGIIILLMPFHFWRIRKARGLVIPRAPEDEVTIRGKSVNTIPNLIIREVVVALVLMAFILVLSTLFNAPLEGKANPGLSPNPTKAPWYFSGIQEMLMHFHPLFSLFIIPVLIVIALLSLPYIDDETSTAGVWFISLKGRKMAVIAALTTAVATPIGILADEYVIDFAARMPGVPHFISNPFGGKFWILRDHKTQVCCNKKRIHPSTFRSVFSRISHIHHNRDMV